MKEKNQIITVKVVKRLLSKKYPQELLNSLTILEDCTINKELYYEEEMAKKCIPFLKGTGYEFLEIRTLRKDIRQELVKQINARAELERNYYDIGILILALKYVSHISEGMRGVHMKNNRIQYCYLFVEKMEGVCGDREALKIAMKTLKLI